jgi:hypothetical protein
MSGHSSDDTFLSLEEMRYWLEIEIKSAQLAAERRIREATGLVQDYAAGKLSGDDANQRLLEHESRWGLGARNPDVELRYEIDEARDQIHRQRLTQKPPTERSR